MFKQLKYLLLFLITFLLGIQATYAKTELILPQTKVSFSIEQNQSFQTLEKQLQPNIGFLKEKIRCVASGSVSAQNPHKFSECFSYALANAGNDFAAYLRNGAKIDAKSLDDAFKHIDNVELNAMGEVKYNSGNLVGCHNVDNFNIQKIPSGRINEVSSSNITDGISEVKYNVLKNDGSGDFMTKADDSLKEFTKTVYNPSVYPKNVMKELGYKAFKDAMDNSGFDILGARTFVGNVNGKNINGYYKVVDGEKIIKTWWIVN